MKRLDFLFAGSLVAALCGCDQIIRPAHEGDRGESYRAAMEDYNAGRMDAAVKGFEKAIAADPSNASARFQLACVLQDVRHDHLGAYCELREYIRLRPGSDKASVATERAARCERLMAPALAKKAGLLGNEAISAENQRLRNENAKLAQELAEVKVKLTHADERSERLAKDNERVRAQLVAPAGAEESTAKPVIPTDEELLDEETPEEDSRRIASDVKQLLDEEREEVPESANTPFAVGLKPPEKPSKPSVKEPEHEPRPDVYVVKDGDTLYKLAIRFYGRRSAWQAIRNANRAIISTDGRIKTGQKLVMPEYQP